MARQACVAADIETMDALFCRPLLVLLAGALPALLIVALTSCAVPAAATEYGANAPIPFVFLPPDNPWNTRVDTLPLDPNSADCIAHMAPKASTVSLPATAMMREGDEWTVGGFVHRRERLGVVGDGGLLRQTRAAGARRPQDVRSGAHVAR
ncbi:MAG: hypothetical protein NTW58_01745 [Actinobacteria bacterium]|nr:hypothetical protein [Actinomycetota bacterium]